MLAGGGIENPRLLLNARSGLGLGNKNDLVGRFFMEHAHGVTGLFVARDSTIEGLMGSYAYHHDADGVPSRWHLALSDRVLEGEELLRYAANLWPTEPEWIPDDLAELARRHIAKRGSPGAQGLYAISFMSEQAPNRESRVVLSDRVGLDGMRLARLEWRLSDIDFRTLVRGQQIVQEEFQVSDAGVVYARQYRGTDGGFLRPRWGGYEARLEGSHHHMGTTRMNEDPEQGVVDANCRVHGVENLFVAGSSVFPTVGYANPTLTIVALATRLADHLRSMTG